MKQLRILSLPLTCLLLCLSACGGDPASDTAAPSPAPTVANTSPEDTVPETPLLEVNQLTTDMATELRARLERIDPTGLVPHPADLQLDRMLSRIHPWLRYGVGLGRRAEQIGSRRYVTLRRIPDAILAQILERTLPEGTHSGFLLLQQSFWRRVSQIQRVRGLTVAFLQPEGPPSIAGLYVHSSRLIAFDVTANEGTLDHEYRHHLQHTALSAGAVAAPPTRVISRTCLEQASVAFGELDATTVQLASWRNTLSSYDLIPAHYYQFSEELSYSDTLAELNTPVLAYMRLNLQYAIDSLNRITRESSCPRELIHAVQEINTTVLRAAVDEAYDFAREIANDRTVMLQNCIDVSSTCVNMPIPSESLDACTELERTARDTLAQAEARRGAIMTMLAEHQQARAERIPLILAALPAPLRTALCQHAAGFSSLSSCEGAR